ncbi:hypothetical protein FRC08_006239 [Ceratobasidium sp. 394]|nr:hypothetical protein FRC08_006239 [Ceratobasidium sp. 394]
MLHPGDLELDVRLNIPDIGEGVVPSRTQSLLTRSNVVALTTSDTNSANGTQIQSFFSCTPRLRALYIPYFDVGILSELAGNDAMVPLLQSLWLSGKEVSLTAMNRVQQLVAARRLRYLVFSSCKFQASYDELPTNAENQNEVTDENGGAGDDEGEGEDEDNDTDEEVDFMAWEPNEVFKEMPESTKKWLSERVENLVICETPTTSIYDGVDPFVQELVKLD